MYPITYIGLSHHAEIRCCSPERRISETQERKTGLVYVHTGMDISQNPMAITPQHANAVQTERMFLLSPLSFVLLFVSRWR